MTTKIENPHVLVIPYPAQGHVLPMLELSQWLAKQGIKVTFVNSEFNHKRVMNSLRPDPDCDIRKVVNMVSIPDGLEPWEDRKDLLKLTRGLYGVMQGELESLVEKLNREEGDNNVSCVIADGTVTWAPQVAEKMGLKRAAFWPASAVSLASFLSIPKLVRDEIIDSNGKILKKPMVELAPDTPLVHSSNFIWASVGDEATQKVIYDMVSKIHSSLKLTHRQICNSSINLEPGVFRAYPSLKPVGPLLASGRLGKQAGHLWPDDPACLAWLDRHPTGSVVYVAFGSFAVLGGEQLRELALGLELTGRPFLWVVRQDVMSTHTTREEEGESFWERVEERGNMVVRWAPQQEVLSHPSVGCFVSHCGWNSTVEGVACGGVPFVCWPYFSDQFMNESYICDEWKIGLRLRKDESGIVGRGEIKEKLERVLGDEGFKERALDLKGKTLDSVGRGNSHENFNDFIEWIKKGVSTFLNPLNKIIEILTRVPSLDTIQSFPLKIQSSLLKPLITQNPFQLLLNLPTPYNPTLIFPQPQPNPPLVAYIRLVQKLVREIRPAQKRHPTAHNPLDRRVPPAMAHKAPDRRVGQNLLLWGPPDYHIPSLLNPLPKAFALSFCMGHHVLPNDPQKRPPRELEPECQFTKLFRVEHCKTPERDVHDRVGGLAVEPRHAGAIFRPEVAGGSREATGGKEWADGSGVGMLGERAGLEIVRRVAVESVGVLVRVGDFSEHVVDDFLSGPVADRGPYEVGGMQGRSARAQLNHLPLQDCSCKFMQ
ncbi:UDP-Glycosyltransferase superfamily protein [Striga asiatica]|uniref:UDP-Glycosyltransferase superfamily protein n=1 Tax=Striga asiatica TaxID=4170 RepID=A0A5A7QWM2_STRAF|nr:UDP-Glycosyltransferase superfamily protein [Striga asiatica]